jgi:hypothetical protein
MQNLHDKSSEHDANCHSPVIGFPEKLKISIREIHNLFLLVNVFFASRTTWARTWFSPNLTLPRI